MTTQMEHNKEAVRQAFKDLEHIRNEIRTAWNEWDSHIEAGQQPVPIQDLDFWAAMIHRDVTELSRIIQANVFKKEVS